MLRNKFVIIWILIISLLFTTGCWDKVEIDQRAFVLALAVDKNSESKDKKDSQIKLVIFTPIPSKIQGAGPEAFNSEKVTGRTIPEALRNVTSRLSRTLFFGQTKVLLIGENLLKDGDMLKEVLDFVEREPDVSRSMKVVAVIGDIDGLTKVKMQFEKIFATHVLGIVDSAEKTTSIKALSLNELLATIREGKGTAVIPYGKVKNDKLELESYLLIKDYKCIGKLKKDWVKVYDAITNDLKHGREFIEYKNAYIPYRITSSEKKMNVTEENGKLKFNIKITLEGDLEEYNFEEEVKKEDIDNLTMKFQESIKKEVIDVTKYFQNDIGHDFLKFNDYTHKYNNKVYKKYKNNWDSAFKNAIVDYDVKVFIRRKGPAY